MQTKIKNKKPLIFENFPVIIILLSEKNIALDSQNHNPPKKKTEQSLSKNKFKRE